MSLVEYHDPDGLFPHLLPLLQAHLPLKNLHWKSPSRPLRSIASLHVNFVPYPSDESSRSDVTRSANPHEIEVDEPLEAAHETSVKSVVVGEAVVAGGKPVNRERRHQIPGLRRTPSLKLYILRCDDKETYKSSSRKLLRQWIDAHVIPVSQQEATNNASNDHDAFEWLILHVIWPGTPAATETRRSKNPHGEPTGSAARPSSNTKWPGRSSSTILEKLRADFNRSGKAAPDQVAQICLEKENLLPYTAAYKSLNGASLNREYAPEAQDAWHDFISKLKNLILMSFSLRINRYEEDVRHKESQRSLPGWNFCTFFILKEGLARAFESVGLLEDALAVYDELALGLDTTVRENFEMKSESHANAFVPSTTELREYLISSVKSMSDPSPITENNANLFDKLLFSSREDHRPKIVSNDISLFHFRCYLFDRQAAHLLRLSGVPLSERNNTSAASTPLDNDVSLPEGRPPSHVKDPTSLAELCRRSSQFVASTARILRKDLLISAEVLQISERCRLIVDNIVRSWTYSVVQQVLDQLNSVSLLSIDPKSEPHQSGSPYRGDDSLSHHINQQLQKTVPLKHAALNELAAHQAELHLLQRRALERTVEQCSWFDNSTSDTAMSVHGQRQVRLVSHTPTESRSSIGMDAATVGLCDHHLLDATSSIDNYRCLYESLSNHAIRCYMLATHTKSAKKLMADLAFLKYQEGDYAAAAGYFHAVARSYNEEKWSALELSSLDMLAKCLKVLNRKDEYIRVVLSLLSKTRGTRISKSRSEGSSSDASTLQSEQRKAMNEHDVFDDYFHDLVDYSRDLLYDVTIPMAEYFEVRVDRAISLMDDTDGFQISVRIRQFLAKVASFCSATVSLLSVNDSQAKGVMLHTDESFTLDCSPAKVLLTSRVSTSGRFFVERITIQAGRLIFIHGALTKNEAIIPLRLSAAAVAGSSHETKKEHILCYPRAHSFYIEARASAITQVGHTRTIDIVLSSGENRIKSADMFVRSASAGLRLRTAEAKTLESDVRISNVATTGVVSLGEMDNGNVVTVIIPYDVERNIAKLSIRVEAHYHTEQGVFLFLLKSTIDVELPLDINVQDVFKERALFSKFWLKSITSAPLYLLNAKLQSSDSFKAESAPETFPPVLAFLEQPVCLTCKISRRNRWIASTPTSGRTLPLIVEYRTMQEVALEQLSAMLQNDILQGPFHKFQRLLFFSYMECMQKCISAAAYSDAGFTRRLQLPSFEQVGWEEILDGLSVELCQPLQEWLHEWHKSHTSFMLALPQDPEYHSRQRSHQIVIDFEVPATKYLHTVSLRLLESSSSFISNPVVVAVGEVLAAQLSIRHTRGWDLSRSLSDAPDNPKPGVMTDFVYRIQATSETWLIGGQKTGCFSAQEDELLTFDVVLIPLRTGQHLLPSVEITLAAPKPLSDSASTLPSNSSAEEQANICITDYTSQSEMIVVIDNMQSTTIGIGQDNNLGSVATMLESEARSIDTAL